MAAKFSKLVPKGDHLLFPGPVATVVGSLSLAPDLERAPKNRSVFRVSSGVLGGRSVFIFCDDFPWIFCFLGDDSLWMRCSLGDVFPSLPPPPHKKKVRDAPWDVHVQITSPPTPLSKTKGFSPPTSEVLPPKKKEEATVERKAWARKGQLHAMASEAGRGLSSRLELPAVFEAESVGFF